MAPALSTSDLIFPSASTNFSKTLGELKRSNLSITHRLRSINEDSEFVCAVADIFQRPLIANERCGSWYIPPTRKQGSAYFKSTDGHSGEWSFSLRRLNLQVLDVVGKGDGCIIVDSTRRGKSMPDALSKTVPIWCAVMNLALFPELPSAHKLHTPQHAVSASEHSQIEARLESFVKQLKELGLDLQELRLRISKPLRPLWIVQGSTLPTEAPFYDDFHPIILCTASRRVRGAEASEGGYIQGAGDDSEGWAKGLTPQLFWENKDMLLRTVEEDLPDITASLIADTKGTAGSGTGAVQIYPTSDIFLGTLATVQAASPDDFNLFVVCSEKPMEAIDDATRKRVLHLQCTQGKLGSRDLRVQLPKVKAHLASAPSRQRILFACPTGKDLAVGAALMTLCIFYGDDGLFTPPIPDRDSMIDKQSIRKKLSWIMASFPEANPSRSTLQSVNSVVMERPY
ncbi:MAG: hypothetical protein M1819_007128 [Sarea resinae]|nr:MAG: hypothetical protein M1819_007128 [Sarea resinae]